MADENTSDLIEFYRQKWVIASLNKCINNEVWVTSPDNTNVAEAAKNLKLVTAIIQGRKLDKERFTTINIHQKYNIPNRERDKSLIVRTSIHTIRSNTSNTAKAITVLKRKQNVQSNNNKKKNKKTIVIDTDVEEDCCEDDNYEKNNHNKENELTLRVKELEYRENDLASKEREIVLREREAKFVKWNYIIVKKRQLKLVN
ncbi:hypothetical protein RhiirC2_775290 [Rhizophagus irregularis]|uniref:Uncharacterized protein n=1 Tax=Rhizophagus irregularis TaxID=588596 RepID=A0A2N1NJD0_9GLOM|nr:hypothetical protein RhiirC2_775290 [Rhizophagus irregularis]